MSNLRMALCGKLAKSIGWSTFAPLDSYPVDSVIHSLNNWGQKENSKTR